MQPAETTTDRRSRTDRRLRARSPIVEELHAALSRDQIEVLFQPQFACSDGTLVGAEALARWQHPERGRLGADQSPVRGSELGLEQNLDLAATERAEQVVYDGLLGGFPAI